jgi:Cu(I)/Ag(I) efflux system membrane fusion protein
MKSLLKWIPALAVIAVLAFIGSRYTAQMLEWFDPLIRPTVEQYAASNPEGSASKAMQGSMTKRESASGGGSPGVLQIGLLTMGLEWEPEVPRAGDNEVTLDLRDTSGIPLEGASVRLNTDAPHSLAEVRPGIYQANISLSRVGEWSIPGEVRTVDMLHVDFVIELTTGEPKVLLASSGVEGSRGDHTGISHWSCSMHPSVHAGAPGTCPICAMDLISVTREEVETGVIRVDAQRQQLIGVKTETVRRQDVVKTIRAVGTLVPDETRIQDVTLKLDVWIGALDADFTGKHVEKGQRLFTFFSPELWSAQEEYIGALRRAQDRPGTGTRLAEAAETRLRIWGLDASTIASIRKKGEPVEYLPYLSPATGTIMEKNIFEGSAVETGQLLYRIADLSTLWVEAEIYESELSLVQMGQATDITLSYLPGREFEGTVSYIYPYLNPETRTARIRIQAANTDGLLKPDMYTNVSIVAPLGERLIVPESAVMYAGRDHVVFVDLGDGRFQPRTIEIGLRDEDWIEVIDGLSSGESVVTSANFLIAAESKLKSGLDKW